MEGTYITKQQRSRQAAELNRTHFTLGNYRSQPLSPQPSTADRATSGVSLAATMRATHFSLGRDKPVTKTENGSRFNELLIPKTSPYVIPDVSIDLRKTHYTLGSYKELPKTSREDMKTVKGEVMKTIMDGNFSRSHHFAYGTDKVEKKSIAKADFVEKIAENDPEEVKKLKNALRQTHFELGNETACFQTTASSEFIMKKSQTEKKNVDIQKEHFKLGTDKATFSSISSSAFNKIPNKHEEFNVERLKDLQKTHFLFGNTKGEYTQTSRDYKGSSIVSQEKMNDWLLRKSNFVMGNSSKPWKTSYGMAHSSSASSVAVSTRSRNIDKQSHFDLGSDKNSAITINQQDFKAYQVENKKDTHQAEYLQKHHFTMGTNKGEFKSMNQKYGQGNIKVEKNTRLMEDLRSTHFGLGNDKREMITTSKQDFKDLRDVKSVEKFERAHGKHSYKDGDGKFEGNTEQKSRFRWIKPVADTKFKFSFDG